MNLNKELAQEMLQFVNSEFYDDYLKFLDYRIERLRSELEHANEVHRLQGAIQELRHLRTLKDQVRAYK